jgi:hypothetical protein
MTWSVVVGHDRRVHVWRKADEIWRPACVDLRGGPRVAVMSWGCITFDGVGTLTEIEGNYKLELVQPISFSPPSQEYFYLKCHI